MRIYNKASIILKENKSEEKRRIDAHNKTINVVNKYFHNFSPYLDSMTDGNIKMSDSIVQQIETDFFHGLTSKPVIRIEPLIAQIALEFGYGQKDAVPQTKMLINLRNIVQIIHTKTRNIDNPLDVQKLNATTYDDFYNLCSKELEELYKLDAQAKNYNNNSTNTNNGGLEAQIYQNTQYRILSNVTYDQANEIGNESCPTSRLCYTQSSSTWKSSNYSDSGRNKCYVLLKDGWENIPAVHPNGGSSPYDEYGLSMIFLFVSPQPKNDLVACNTRWNHRATYESPHYTDMALTKDEIAKLLHINSFEDVFVGYKKEEIETNNQFDFYRLNQAIQNGDYSSLNTQEISDKLWIVTYANYYNVINLVTKKLVSNRWFNHIAYQSFNYLSVEIDYEGENYLNIMNTNGEIISKTWFDRLDINNEEHYVVCRNTQIPYTVVYEDSPELKVLIEVNEDARDINFETEPPTAVIKGYVTSLGQNPKKLVKLLSRYDNLCKAGKFIAITIEDDVEYYTNKGELITSYSQESLNEADDVVSQNGEYLITQDNELVRYDGKVIPTPNDGEWFIYGSFIIFSHNVSPKCDIYNEDSKCLFKNVYISPSYTNADKSYFAMCVYDSDYTNYDKKVNLIFKNGELLFDQWFDGRMVDNYCIDDYESRYYLMSFESRFNGKERCYFIIDRLTNDVALSFIFQHVRFNVYKDVLSVKYSADEGELYSLSNRKLIMKCDPAVEVTNTHYTNNVYMTFWTLRDTICIMNCNTCEILIESNELIDAIFYGDVAVFVYENNTCCFYDLIQNKQISRMYTHVRKCSMSTPKVFTCLDENENTWFFDVASKKEIELT